MRYENKKSRNKIIIPFKNYLLKREIIMKVKLLIIISFLIPILLKAQVKVEKVLETSSVADYNKWVQENKEKYPELQPIYFQIEKIKAGRTVQDAPKTFNPPPDHPGVSKYNIYYCDDEGRVIKDETITGYVKIGDLGNEFIILIQLNNPSFEFATQWVYTIKDKHGDVLFKIENEKYIRYLDKNLFIELPTEYSDNSVIKIFDEKKKEVASLTNLARFSKIFKTPNGEYYIFYSGGNITIISKELKKVWHYREGGRIAYNSNKYIAIGKMGKVSVYTLKGKFKKIYHLAETWEGPSVCFVDDGKYLFASLKNRIFYFDNTNFKELWHNDVSLYVDQLIYPFKSGRYILYVSVRVGYIIDTKTGEIITEIEFPIKKRQAFLKSESGEPFKTYVPVPPIDYFVKNKLLIIKQGGLYKDKFKIILLKFTEL